MISSISCKKRTGPVPVLFCLSKLDRLRFLVQEGISKEKIEVIAKRIKKIGE